MANIIKIKRGLVSNIEAAVLKNGELALAFNADRTAVQLWVGTSTAENGGTDKVLLNPDITVPSKVSDLTNDSGFQTNAEVTAAINAAISTTYKAGGSKDSVAELPALTAANEGFVYNMTAQFTTTADFVEGASKKHPAGTNVAIVNTGTAESPVYKYDVLAGFVDLSGYVEKEAGKGLSTEDYTSEEKTKLAGIAAGAQVNTLTGVKGDSETDYRTGDVNITKANIGLGNADNTSDMDKPVSTATQTALNGKMDASADIDGGTF